MAIYKQKGSRYWWLSVWRKDRPRLRISSGTESREEAEIIERTLRLAHGRATPRQRLIATIDAILGADGSAENGAPLSGLWEAYRAASAASGGRKPSELTDRNRRQACKRLADWAAEHWPKARTMQEVDQAVAFAFGDWLAKDGASAKTRANLIGDLGTVWRALMPRTGLAVNPWTMARPKPEQGKHGRAFTQDEINAILTAAKEQGHDWWEVCQVARYTGLRYGDIAHLRWSAVDLIAGRIRAAPRKTARHGIELGLPLHPVVVKILAGRKQEDEFVFPFHADHYGHMARESPFADILKAAKIEAKGAKLSIHCFRHTFRTRLSEAGASQEIAMALGGWTQAATAGLYSHDYGALEKAVKALK